MAIKYDWPAIKATFVEGIDVDGQRVFPSQKELAASHGVTRETLCRRASAENWNADRQAFITRVSQVRANLNAETLGKAGLDLDSAVNTAATLLVDQVLQHIAAGIKTGIPLAPGTVKTLAAALLQAHQAGRLAKGDATSISESTVTATVNKAEEAAILERMSDEAIHDLISGQEAFEAAAAVLAAELATSGQRTQH